MHLYRSFSDLSGKMFSFPEASAVSHVKLSTGTRDAPISAMTMCMRYFSKLTRGQSLFSLATRSHDNDLLLFKPGMGKYGVHVAGAHHGFSGLPDTLNQWNSVCWTWQSSSGLTQVWLNDKQSEQAVIKPTVSITGKPSIILGQEQDNYGGGFSARQSFVGAITDVHFWDSVISPCEIRLYMEGMSFVPGNIINWNALDYSSKGKVFVETSDFHCNAPCLPV